MEIYRHIHSSSNIHKTMSIKLASLECFSHCMKNQFQSQANVSVFHPNDVDEIGANWNHKQKKRNVDIQLKTFLNTKQKSVPIR